MIRKKLTDEEFNMVLKLTHKLKIDGDFDIYDCGEIDKWKDWESYKIVALSTGFEWLADAIAYPLSHEGFTKDESILIANLLKEFAKISDDFYNFLIKENI